MDTDELAAARDDTIVVVDLSGTELDTWFDLLCTGYLASKDAGWDDFRTNLEAAAEANHLPGNQVELFVKHMEEYQPGDRMDILKEINEIGQYLSTRYHDLLAAAEADPDAGWFAYLADFDRYWDGLDSTWERFKQLLLHNETYAAYVGELLATAEAGDKFAVLRSYGIEPYDAYQFNEYARTADGAWDGTEETWADFRDAFLANAGTELRHPAAFLIEHVQTDAAGKVAALARYGIGIGLSPQLVVEQVAESSLRQAMQENPALATLPTETITRTLVDVMAERIAQPVG